MRRAAALCLLVGLASPVSAQGVFDMGVLSNTLSQGAVTQSERERAARQRPQVAVRPPGSASLLGPGAWVFAAALASPARPGRVPGAARYTPSPELAQATVRGFAERLGPANPPLAEALLRTNGRGEYAAAYRALAQAFRLAEDDAADAAAAALLAAWTVVRGAPDSALAGGVRAQMAARIAAEPRLAGSAEARARLGEEMKLAAVLIESGWRDVSNGPGAQGYARGIATMFREYGVDLGALRPAGGAGLVRG